MAEPESMIEGNSERLIGFIGAYTGLLERQLVAVRQVMLDTVEAVMLGVAQMSEVIESRKKEAESILAETYALPGTNPPEQAAVAIAEPLSPEIMIRADLSRSTSRFMAYFSTLNELDTEVEGLMMGMIGAVSADDVIAQRIDHVCDGLNAMQIGLNYILLDYESRCHPAGIAAFEKDLKLYTKRRYTMDAELEEFRATFPEELKKAS